MFVYTINNFMFTYTNDETIYILKRNEHTGGAYDIDLLYQLIYLGGVVVI